VTIDDFFLDNIAKNVNPRKNVGDLPSLLLFVSFPASTAGTARRLAMVAAQQAVAILQQTDASIHLFDTPSVYTWGSIVLAHRAALPANT